MKRLLFIIFSSFFLLLSCAKQKPNGILSESKATDLFMEASLIDAYLNTLPIDSGRKTMPVLYANLFKDFKIDSNQFKDNLDYYYGNPILTEKIYTEVSKKLSEYDVKFRVEDSIRNVFVQDSIRYITNIQQRHTERVNLTLNYSKDTTTYTYKDDGLKFLNRLNLNLNAYGIQVPAIVAPVQEKPAEITQEAVAPEELPVEEEATSKSEKKIPLDPVKDTIIKKDITPLQKDLSPKNPKKLQIEQNR